MRMDTQAVALGVPLQLGRFVVDPVENGLGARGDVTADMAGDERSRVLEDEALFR